MEEVGSLEVRVEAHPLLHWWAVGGAVQGMLAAASKTTMCFRSLAQADKVAALRRVETRTPLLTVTILAPTLVDMGLLIRLRLAVVMAL